MWLSSTAIDRLTFTGNLLPTLGWAPDEAHQLCFCTRLEVYSVATIQTLSPCCFRDARLDDRALALDGNPSSYFLANFDRQNTPEHDEGGAIFLVVDRLAFKFAARLQRVGKPGDDFGISTRSLKNPRRLADDFGGIVSR